MNRTVGVLLEQTLFRPFKMLAQEPILVLVTLYLSVVYAVLYACRSYVLRFRRIRLNHELVSIRGTSRHLHRPSRIFYQPLWAYLFRY